MNYIKNLEEVKMMCRVCLTQSEDMISMDNKLDDMSEDSPLIFYALENIISHKIQDHPDYPREVCRMCYGNIRISFDLKLLFNKSQNVLEKYIASVKTPFPEYPYSYNIEDESSKMSTISEDNNNDLDIDKSRIIKTEGMEVIEIDVPQIDMPKKIVKLKMGTTEKHNVKVKWVEGNKFTIEKIEDVSTIPVVPRILHLMVHKCSYCHKRFSTKEKLTAHLGTCKKFVLVKCEFCHLKFSSQLRKQHHIKAKHNPDAPLIKCDLCDQAFKNYNARSYHKQTKHSVEGKKYSCNLCGKAFFIRNSLNQHMECHSKDVSRVVCPVCGKSFHYRGGLFYHMKIHRNERNYVCSYCKSRFLTMASLKRHTRIHTGERPYSCSVCPKTFCSIGEVKTHERRHAGLKPFHCVYCKKSFISPYNLKLHCSSHSGLHPCDFCDKGFLNTEFLKFHLEIKHNIKKNTIEEDI